MELRKTPSAEIELLRSQISTLEQLLEVYEQAATGKADELEARVQERTLDLARANEALQQEIADRRLAEEEARSSEARKTAILESALDAIVSMDHTGAIVEWNAAAERLFGYSHDEAIGREMASLIIPPALRSAHRRGLARYLATGEGPMLGTRIEVTAYGRAGADGRSAPGRADGVEFPCELTITRIPTDGPPRFTGTIRDITERRRAEEHVRHVNAEKKRFYREVIRAVTNGKLHLVDAAEIPTEGRCLLEMPVTSPADYPVLRQHVQEIAESVGMKADEIADMVLASGEATTNAVKHATQGRCTITLADDRLIVRVQDDGSGIRPEDLPGAVLQPGFSTKVSLGMGYTLMLALVDRVWLATGPEGTIVQLEKWLHPEEHPDPTLAALMAQV